MYSQELRSRHGAPWRYYSDPAFLGFLIKII
jgi:hypothetical protein